MDWNGRIRAALAESSAAPDPDVVEELAQHAAAAYEASRAEGRSREEADTAAAALIRDWVRDAGTLRRTPHRAPAVVAPPASAPSRLAGLAQDLRYAARLLRRQPRFALLAMLTIGLGIAATSLLFSVAYGVMKPLPWAQADRIVVLKETRGGKAPRFGAFTNAAYLAWQGGASTVDDLAAWRVRTATLTGAGDPERIQVVATRFSLKARNRNVHSNSTRVWRSTRATGSPDGPKRSSPTVRQSAWSRTRPGARSVGRSLTRLVRRGGSSWTRRRCLGVRGSIVILTSRAFWLMPCGLWFPETQIPRRGDVLWLMMVQLSCAERQRARKCKNKLSRGTGRASSTDPS